MANRPDITPELCRQLLRYEAKTGKLFWLPRGEIAFDRYYAGREAFTADFRGYKVGGIYYRRQYAHRVVFAIHHGKWPEGEIDHINGNRSDNRIENLRDATSTMNRRNAARRSNNTSGFTGVKWSEPSRKWQVTAGSKANGTYVYLGTYASKADAIEARKEYNATAGYTARHGS